MLRTLPKLEELTGCNFLTSEELANTRNSRILSKEYALET